MVVPHVLRSGLAWSMNALYVVMDLLEGSYSYNRAGLVEISDVIFCAVIPFEIILSKVSRYLCSSCHCACDKKAKIGPVCSSLDCPSLKSLWEVSSMLRQHL